MRLLLLILLVFLNSNPCFAEALEFTEPQKGLYVVKIYDVSRIEPYVAEELETITQVAKKTCARAIINAGYFDPKNKKTASFIVKNGKLIADIKKNENIMDNLSIKCSRLAKIMNRTELRVYQDNSTAITNHHEKDNKKLKHSIQAGPLLIPYIKLTREGFRVRNKKGKVVIDTLRPAKKLARTALGIKDNITYLIVATDANPMTIYELRDFIKNLGVNAAMAFDGGSSTALYVDVNGCAFSTGQRALKSFLLVK